MADVTLHDGPAPAADAPPSSAGVSTTEQPGVAVAPAADLPEEVKNRLDRILYSDIGVSLLLTRLKQSVSSARDYSTFLKKRAQIEEEHAQSLRKLSRSTHDAAHRTEHRQESYSQSYDEISHLHERIADHGMQYAVSLHQMADDLHEHVGRIERGRKQWKQTGLSAEKKVQEAEASADKAKAKYDSLAEQYDRVKTGDKQGGKFGLKGPKSAAQHEEDLLRKVQNADSDYSDKVQAARTARQELVSTLRPQAVQNIQQLIAECDSALTVQMQKYGTFSEKLLLGQSVCVVPVKNGSLNGATIQKSLKDIILQIDNQKDFHDYIFSHENDSGAVASEEIKYERHPTLATASGGQSSASPSSTQNRRQSVLLSQSTPQPAAPAPPSHAPPQNANATQQLPYPAHTEPSISAPPFQPPYPVSSGPPQQAPAHAPLTVRNTPAIQLAGSNPQPPHLPPLNPVFGVSLDDLFRRDRTPVPMVVCKCFQAIEFFGLDMEGIYRLSGSANHINHMKSLFNNDSSQVDFTNPESFYHDINSVAGLLKQFFRELPDPLFTLRYYSEFINAAHIEDDIKRRDSMHALINNLPDAHYATLRLLVLHLNKIQEHSAQNRMNAGNIAICFGPTLMGGNAGGNIADAGWQVRVIETILVNTFQIFDDD
ncbi:hypothetical protein ASPZODRAFT_136275 [Penicilliopsis zonata CBS 506.65]|uniref:Rho-GAP domain-containing protein n=1 Tax=Penicilliopsis zonata CBS 506.65 TaxID=1073090 RepID=A0A1L9S8D5_9EURO|nr:hypothetical protein ASPZODRAFT_136275 [Penicilliopsis zonata CBS 506.65]OJJ43417.1 hypothetical protein ASPZODRAFT_136275 [Penicilliopsis zonata CBS 506.65]